MVEKSRRPSLVCSVVVTHAVMKPAAAPYGSRREGDSPLHAHHPKMTVRGCPATPPARGAYDPPLLLRLAQCGGPKSDRHPLTVPGMMERQTQTDDCSRGYEVAEHREAPRADLALVLSA